LGPCAKEEGEIRSLRRELGSKRWFFEEEIGFVKSEKKGENLVFRGKKKVSEVPKNGVL